MLIIAILLQLDYLVPSSHCELQSIFLFVFDYLGLLGISFAVSLNVFWFLIFASPLDYFLCFEVALICV